MSTPTEPPKLPVKPAANPAFVAMGLPNIRAKLPSRNWSIFFTVVGAFSAAVYYDRRETRLIQSRYCNLVSHLAKEPLQPHELPRKVTVYLCAPPGDGLSVAREHFRDYIKPVLNAAAVDFDVVEGRKMGEVRAKVAEGVRRRRRDGWGYEVPGEDGSEGGVIAVGRMAWKEWTRGIQEGWFGPLEQPMPVIEKAADEIAKEVVVESLDAVIAEGEKKEGEAEEKPEEKKEEEKKEKPTQLPEFITTAEYPAATLPATAPPILPPAGIISFPHLLGFLNTPIRIYRYLNRRAMAEEVCKEAAAVALGHYRPFIVDSPEPEGMLADKEQIEHAIEDQNKPHETEIESLLKEEEKDWISAVWKEERYVGVWREALTVDERIKHRMRRFFLPTEAEVKIQEAKAAGSNEW